LHLAYTTSGVGTQGSACLGGVEWCFVDRGLLAAAVVFFGL